MGDPHFSAGTQAAWCGTRSLPGLKHSSGLHLALLFLSPLQQAEGSLAARAGEGRRGEIDSEFSLSVPPTPNATLISRALEGTH